jgi:hypothetical protein
MGGIQHVVTIHIKEQAEIMVPVCPGRAVVIEYTGKRTPARDPSHGLYSLVVLDDLLHDADESVIINRIGRQIKLQIVRSGVTVNHIDRADPSVDGGQAISPQSRSAAHMTGRVLRGQFAPSGRHGELFHLRRQLPDAGPQGRARPT